MFFVVDHGLGHIWRISDENEDGMVDSTEAVIWWQASGSSDVMDIAVTEDAQVLATQALSPTRLHHFFDEARVKLPSGEHPPEGAAAFVKLCKRLPTRPRVGTSRVSEKAEAAEIAMARAAR